LKLTPLLLGKRKVTMVPLGLRLGFLITELGKSAKPPLVIIRGSFQ